MEVFTQEEALLSKDTLLRKIITGKLFIHPTDTIYGIGCNAMNEQAVQNLRDTKRQTTRPFSIMVPSIEWIRENCIITPDAEEWLDKLPGPYTLILNLKDESNLADSVNFGNGTIGVRLPNHWFVQILKYADLPIITTSANITGENFITRKEDLDPMIEMKCDFMIDEGKKRSKPSTIINLTSEEISIKERE